MLFSILVPTLVERRALFSQLHVQLRAQIDAAHLADEVEICVFEDNRQQSLGAKRNALLQHARGDYSAFVDDDDSVAADYISRIAQALRGQPAPDCLGITGTVYFRGSHPHRFVYSLQYDHYFSRAGVYYRPPYILNPVRRAIALQFPFEPVNFNEDVDWAMRLVRAHALHHEILLESSLYNYYSRRRWQAQWFVDVTEPIRHPLGLQLANRLRLKRWLTQWRRPLP